MEFKSTKQPQRSRAWLPIWALCLVAGVPGCGGSSPEGGATGSAELLFELPAELPPKLGSVEGPALFAGRAAVDFGTIWQGASREVRFPLTNVGTEPVHIQSIKASCGCTLVATAVIEADGERALVYKEPLPPGTRVEVALRFDSRGRHGREAKFVTVYSDSPGGRLRLQVGVDTQPFLVAEPETLSFERVFVERELLVKGFVTAADGEPFELSLASDEALPKGLSLALVRETPAKWALEARLAPDTAAGNLLAHVTLVSDRPFERSGDLTALNVAPEVFGADGLPRHYLDLWVTALVVGAVEVSPPYLPFGFLAKGALTSASARIECFDPALLDAFAAAPPTVRVLDAEGLPLAESMGPAAASAFTPTLRLVTTETPGLRPLSAGALAAWDLEVAVQGFSGEGRNRLLGRVELDFGPNEIPDRFLEFQVILQP